jgi:hypothetical protein
MKTLIQRVDEGQSLRRAYANSKSSYNNRNQRIKKKLTDILNKKYSYFLTLTIDDKNYHKDYKTFERKLKTTLKETTDLWIANNDYGDTTQRLHFHAVIGNKQEIQKEDIQLIWKYGFIDLKKIKKRSVKALQKYITKMMYHSTKNTVYKIYYQRIKKMS